MSILDGAFTGLVIGLLFSIPAFLSDIVRHGENLPILVDVRNVRGRAVMPDHIFFWSVLLHLALATVFGAVFPLLVSRGAFPSFDLRFVALYTAGFFSVVGLVIAPLLGLGLFARREGPLVWLELLLMHVLYGGVFWYAATRLLAP